MRTAVHLHDVVVVGAGPVGSVAAERLAARGLDVLLLERGPGDRTHGPRLNGMAERVLPLLLGLEVEPVIRAAQVQVGGHLVMEAAHGGRMDGYWGDGNRRVFFERAPVDAALRARAVARGATLLDRVSRVVPHVSGGEVTGVEFTRGGETTRVGARWVLVADGRGSRTAEAAGFRVAPEHRFRRLYAGRAFTGTAFEEDIFSFAATLTPGVQALVFTGPHWGPRGAYVELEVDLDAHPRFMSRFHGDTDAALADATLQSAFLRRGLGHLLGRDAGSWHTNWHTMQLAGGCLSSTTLRNAVVLGDAAACVDPLASSGLTLGLQGLAQFLEMTDGVAPGGAWRREAFESARRDAVGAVQRFAWMLRLGLQHPRAWDAGLRVMQRSARRKRMLLDVFNGVRGHGELFTVPGALEFLVGPWGAGVAAQGVALAHGLANAGS